MKFENEFVNLVTADARLEQLYKGRFEKLDKELKVLQDKLDTLKKQQSQRLDNLKKDLAEYNRFIKEFDDKGDFYKATHPSERGRYEVLRNGTELSIKRMEDAKDIYDTPNIRKAQKDVLDKLSEIDDIQRDYNAIHKVEKETQQIKDAVDKNIGLSKQEYDDIVQSQLNIELQKKQTEKVKIFMGVGVGLVTLLILFKFIKK
jgi:hypothetical protein